MQTLADEILKALDIQGSYSLTRLTGNENENYLVQSQNKTVVVKRLNAQYSAADTELEAAYRTVLAHADLPLSMYVPLNGEQATLRVGDSTYVATPYVPGKDASYSPGLAKQSADLLAHIHTVDMSGLSQRRAWFREGYIADSLDRIDDRYAGAKRDFARLRLETPDFWDADLPQGIVHGDLHNENIIVNAEGKIVSIIDWEETTIAPLLLDVAHTVRSMSFRREVCDENIFHAFLGSYQNRRPLMKNERQLLGAAIRYSALILSVWAHTKASQGQMEAEMLEDLGNRYKLVYMFPEII